MKVRNITRVNVSEVTSDQIEGEPNSNLATHFWLATVGIVLYIVAMWIAGITQGLMWRSYDSMGFLQYSFVETLKTLHPLYVTRAIGGLLFLLGACIMAYNF